MEGHVGAFLKYCGFKLGFSYLVEFVLLAELYTLSPAVVALVQVSSNTSELDQFMFL